MKHRAIRPGDMTTWLVVVSLFIAPLTLALVLLVLQIGLYALDGAFNLTWR